MAKRPSTNVEIVSERTLQTKTFDLGRGKRRLRLSMGLQHYERDGILHDVDRTIYDLGDHFEVDTGYFKLSVQKDTLSYHYESRDGWYVDTRLSAIGTTTHGFHFDPIAEGTSSILFPDVLPGIDIRLKIGVIGIELFKILKSDKAERTFVWEVDQPKGNKNIGYNTIGWDRKKDELGRHTPKAGKWRVAKIDTTKTLVSSSEEREIYSFSEQFAGLVSETVDAKTRRKEWKSDVQYPVIIDVPDITENITAGNQDAATSSSISISSSTTTSSSTSFNNTYNGLTAGYSGFMFGSSGFKQFYYASFWFTTVAIPVGSTIDTASLVVNVLFHLGSSVTNDVYGIDEDSASVPSAGSLYRDRNHTSATGSFNSGPTGSQSIDVTDVVQEIVDRPGWSSGNNLGFWIDGDSSPNESLVVIEAYENAGTDEAYLEIDYTEGGAVEVDVNVFGAEFGFDISNIDVDVSAAAVVTNVSALNAEIGFEAGSPDITQVHIINLPNYTVGYEIGSPGMTLNSDLSVVSTEFGFEIGTIGISEVVSVTVEPVELGFTISPPGLIQAQELGVSNYTLGYDIQSVDIAQVFELGVSPAEFGYEVSAPSLAQTYKMSPGASEYGYESLAVEYAIVYPLNVSDIEIGYESQSDSLRYFINGRTPARRIKKVVQR